MKIFYGDGLADLGVRFEHSSKLPGEQVCKCLTAFTNTPGLPARSSSNWNHDVLQAGLKCDSIFRCVET